jgi:hypothetical protein
VVELGVEGVAQHRVTTIVAAATEALARRPTGRPTAGGCIAARGIAPWRILTYAARGPLSDGARDDRLLAPGDASEAHTALDRRAANHQR